MPTYFHHSFKSIKFNADCTVATPVKHARYKMTRFFNIKTIAKILLHCHEYASNIVYYILFLCFACSISFHHGIILKSSCVFIVK